MSALPLAGRSIVVPESRELDLFSAMLEKQGARVLRCPMVKVRPLEQTADLDAWLDRFIAGAASDIVFYTGEGVNHITARARATGRREAWVAALTKAHKIVRGPKPVKALRGLGLAPDLSAGQPTTEGLAETLWAMDFTGKTVALQLYPGNDGSALRSVIEARGGAADPVTPYRYASDDDDRHVSQIIAEMAGGGVDLIAFTSTPQVRRMAEVAAASGQAHSLARALKSVRIAAVGPVTAEAVEQAGGVVAIQPPASFHLKPLVAEIVKALGR